VRCAAAAAALVAAALTADAGLIGWQDQVNVGTAPAFVETNISGATTRDIGALSGDKTYEFIVNARDAGASSRLTERLAFSLFVSFPSDATRVGVRTRGSACRVGV